MRIRRLRPDVIEKQKQYDDLQKKLGDAEDSLFTLSTCNIVPSLNIAENNNSIINNYIGQINSDYEFEFFDTTYKYYINKSNTIDYYVMIKSFLFFIKFLLNFIKCFWTWLHFVEILRPLLFKSSMSTW